VLIPCYERVQHVDYNALGVVEEVFSRHLWWCVNPRGLNWFRGCEIAKTDTFCFFDV
jgi:hypothetical protein